MKPKTLLVLAGGKSRRFGELKQLTPLGPQGETLIELSVQNALRNGFTEVVFLIRTEIAKDFKSKIGEKLEKKFGPCFKYVFQDEYPFPLSKREKPWGTGHAILSCEKVVKNNFAVIYADIYCGSDCLRTMSHFLNQISPQSFNYALCTFELKNTLSEHGAMNRGICFTDENGFIKEIKENFSVHSNQKGIVCNGFAKKLNPEAAVPEMLAFSPTIFPLLKREFQSFYQEIQKNPAIFPEKEFYITVALNKMIQNGEITVKMFPSADPWIGVTYAEDKKMVMEKIKKIFGKN